MLLQRPSGGMLGGGEILRRGFGTRVGPGRGSGGREDEVERGVGVGGADQDVHKLD
jgi:hypothetical protein